MLNKKVLLTTIAFVLLMAILLVSCANGVDSTYSSNASGNASSDSIANNVSNATNSSDGESVANNTSSEWDDSNGSVENGTSSEALQDESEPDATSNGEESNIGSNSSNSTSSEASNASQGSNESSSVSSEHVHSYKKMEVLPTCTEKGYTKNVCYCGDYYITDEKPTVKHNMAYDSTTAPTETTRGKYVYKCSYGCGYTVVEEIYSYNEYAALLVPYVLQSINEYRAKEGAPAVKLSNQLTKFSQYRAFQLTTNFNHSMADSDKAAEATHVGVYYSEYISHSSGEFVPARWCAQYYGEVIQKGYIQSYQTVKSGKELQDDLAKAANTIIQAFWNSPAHKDILAEKNDVQIYVGIGVYKGHVCINLSSHNQDETGYEHYWYDDVGNESHMCMEFVKDDNPHFECMWSDRHK